MERARDRDSGGCVVAKTETITVTDLTKVEEGIALAIIKDAYGAKDDIEARFMLRLMQGKTKGDAGTAKEIGE
jgi:hypothetical protein